jgi:WD repeat-containing protein 19
MQIPDKYVDRIKKVAMKPVNDEIPEPKSPCPFCKELVPEYNDDCPKCLNYIPFCIASAKYLFLHADTL